MKLYSYFRSSAAYRVRIALNLKGIAYETVSVHLVKDGGHNKRPEFRAVNPQMRVPVLVTPGGEHLLQSLAIIEYLDETQPEPPLLPKDPIARAKVRALADLIACDIHPLNNTSPLRYLKNVMGQEQSAIDAWYHHWVIAGLRGARSADRAWALRLRRAGDDRRHLPGAAGLQCAAAESSAGKVSQDRRRRRRLHGAARLRPRAAREPAGCGIILSPPPCGAGRRGGGRRGQAPPQMGAHVHRRKRLPSRPPTLPSPTRGEGNIHTLVTIAGLDPHHSRGRVTGSMFTRLLRSLGHTTLGVVALAASAAAQGAPNQPASNPVCVRLESQLAAINSRLDRSDPRRPDQARRRRRRQAAGRPRPHPGASAQAGLRGPRLPVAVLEPGAAMRADQLADPADARQPRPRHHRSRAAQERHRQPGQPAPRADRTTGAEQLRRAIYRRRQRGRTRAASSTRCSAAVASGGGTILNPGGDGAPAGTFHTVCVRTCDGYYFPISYSTVPSRFADDERSCQRLCPAAEVALYSFHNPGEDMEQAVSVERPALYGAAERLPLSQGVHGGLLVPQARARAGPTRSRTPTTSRRCKAATSSSPTRPQRRCRKRRSSPSRSKARRLRPPTQRRRPPRTGECRYRSGQAHRADRRPAVRVAAHRTRASTDPYANAVRLLETVVRAATAAPMTIRNPPRRFRHAAPLTRVRSGSGSGVPGSWNRLTIG